MYKLLISLSLILTFCVAAQCKEIPDDNNVLMTVNEANLAELEPGSIKLLLWNIYKGNNQNWDSDFIEISKDHDLLVLQETFLDSFMLGVFKDLPVFEFNMATSWLDGKGIETGVATASIVCPVSVNFQRSKYREPIADTPKMTLFTEYSLAGLTETLLVVNIHGINFVSAKKLEHMIKETVNVINKHSGPVVFAGDFNTWTNKKIKIMKTHLGEAGLAEVLFNPDTRTKVMGHFIDYVWVKDLSVNSSRVYSDLKSSDHKAISVDLSY